MTAGRSGLRWALGAVWVLAAAPARGAPIGPGVEAVAVLGLEADLSNDLGAKSLTNALRQQVLDSAEYTLGGESAPLAVKAGEAKCSLKGLRRPLTEASDLSFDGACLARLGQQVGAKRYFWGHVYSEGSRPFVRVHLWREGEPDRAVTMPYDEAERDRLAERIYRKLATPEKVGDVALTGAAALEGEVFVDGRARGPMRPRVELTLPGGEHAFELRNAGEVVARAKAVVIAGAWVDVRLEAGGEAAVAAPAPFVRVSDIPPLTRRREPSAWPWVFGGVGVAGLIGAGAFFSLYRGEQGELDDACAPDKSCRGQQASIDRSKRYSALSLVSLGVGVGAGVGLYFSLASRRPQSEALDGRARASLWGGVSPLAGGGAAALAGGRF